MHARDRAAGRGFREPRRRAPSGAARRRLSRSADFDRVYRDGRSHASRYLVLHAFPRADRKAPARLGVSVGRKLGGAVERNRIKRLLREAFWASGAGARGHDVVIVARADASELADEDGEARIRAALEGLLLEAGLMEESGE